MFDKIYLNENCNICRLGEDLKEYRFNTSNNKIQNVKIQPVCPLLTATCKVEVKPTGIKINLKYK